MPLLCNYFGLDTPCCVALQSKHYFTESDLIKGLYKVASNLTPSLLLKAIDSKSVECFKLESFLASWDCNCFSLVLLNFPFGIQEHILKASAKKLVAVHLLKP